MGNSDLKIRAKDYALSVIRLFAELPKRTEAQVMGRQLLRSGTSVGAQYRETSRAKSNADFISKMEGSLQELEESEYWLELLAESGFVPEERLATLKKETGGTERYIRQHRRKHQSQIEKSEIVAYPLSFCLYPSEATPTITAFQLPPTNTIHGHEIILHPFY